MEITVRSVKVLKAGTNQYGDWKLVKVYTDNEEYTTLADGADHITGGSTINITDMDEDAKGKKFKKFEIIALGNIPSVPVGTDQPSDNEYWERKQAIERSSIEAQVAFKGMVELISTGMVKADTREYKATIEWAMTRLHSVSQIMAKIEEAKGETNKGSKGNKKAQTEPADRQDSGEATEPKTAGQLFNWIMSQDKNIKVPRAWIEAEYGVSHGEALTIETIQELYNQIKADKEW